MHPYSPYRRLAAVLPICADDAPSSFIVLKEIASHFLVQCVRKVHAGGRWFERHAAGCAIETLLRHQDGLRDMTGLLTPRELEIVRLVARGFGNKRIADTLSISEGTVKIHLYHIYKKLLLDGRLALTLCAREKGLV